MDDSREPDRLLRKLRQLGETFDEIDEWIRSGKQGRLEGPAAVDALLHSVLSRRVSLESIPRQLGASP